MALKRDDLVESRSHEPLRRVGVRELKERTSEVVRRVREDHETVDITFRGEVVAHLVPVASDRPLNGSMAREEPREQGREISRPWPGGIFPVDALSTERSQHEQPSAPLPRMTAERIAREERRRELAERIGRLWPKDVSAVDAVRDMRDDGC